MNPAVFAEKKDCQTLQIRTRDEVLKIDVILNYTVFNDCDAIVRSSKIINNNIIFSWYSCQQRLQLLLLMQN